MKEENAWLPAGGLPTGKQPHDHNKQPKERITIINDKTMTIEPMTHHHITMVMNRVLVVPLSNNT